MKKLISLVFVFIFAASVFAQTADEYALTFFKKFYDVKIKGMGAEITLYCLS